MYIIYKYMVYTNICILKCTCHIITCMSLSLSLSLSLSHTHTHVCVYTLSHSSSACVAVPIVCVCIHVCMYVCMCVCVCMYVDSVSRRRSAEDKEQGRESEYITRSRSSSAPSLLTGCRAVKLTSRCLGCSQVHHSPGSDGRGRSE